MERMISVNPATGSTIKEYPQHAIKEIETIVRSAGKAFEHWKTTGFRKRSDLMLKLARNLRDGSETYARLITAEMGKPVKQAMAEIEKCAGACEYYAARAEEFLSGEHIETDASDSYVAYRPLGVILAVMPWNFPFWQVFRFAAPAVMAGNTALLKHASNVTGCALAIEELFRKSGFPADIFRTIKAGSQSVGSIIENPVVSAVTITGSVGAGKAVAAKAGSRLKKSVLELGGSDPYIILEDADLDHAVKVCVYSRLINTGQSCIAAKRFIVVKRVLENFEKKFVAEMKNYRTGDPMDQNTDLGPLASETLRDELHRQVLASIGDGAECLLGGEIPAGKGAWYPATVLARVRPGMPVYDDETFGPVAAIIDADDEEDAIRIANDSRFGLGAAVFSRDSERARTIAETRINAGSCFVNDFVRSDPRLPFGGIGDSGYGRELSYFGIREFTNIKTVYIR
jgi:succinate-semialdehyde dehydrogenase / glutarate-semialdehyde dehydrogenase